MVQLVLYLLVSCTVELGGGLVAPAWLMTDEDVWRRSCGDVLGEEMVWRYRRLRAQLRMQT